MRPAASACSAARSIRRAKSSAVNGVGVSVAAIVGYEAFACAYLLHEERLGERDVLDLARIDALVGGVDQALRLLHAEQHDLRVGERLLEDRAERDRAALTLERHVASVGVTHGSRHRLEAGPFGRALEGLPVGLSLEVELDVPRRHGLEMLDQLRLRLLRRRRRAGFAGRCGRAPHGARRQTSRRPAGSRCRARWPPAGPQRVGDAVTRARRRRRARRRPCGTAPAGTPRPATSAVASSRGPSCCPGRPARWRACG